jgi:GNAT superfamily N-acetyltransferase
MPQADSMTQGANSSTQPVDSLLPPLQEDDEELGSGSSDDTDDEDYNPAEDDKKRLKPQRRLKKRRKKKKAKPPDLREMSLPKAQSRLDPGLVLGLIGSTCTLAEDVAMSISRPPKLADDAPTSAQLTLLSRAPRPTRGTDDDPGVAQYRAFYGVQLPGMPFYHDAAQLLYSVPSELAALCGGEAAIDVLGGATFRLVELSTSESCLLILDVLALAVSPDRARRGVGKALVRALKAIASREAAARGASSIVLTQADLSCLGFWAKQGFVRAIDANSLVRSLRRASGHVIFNGATPMAVALKR